MSKLALFIVFLVAYTPNITYSENAIKPGTIEFLDYKYGFRGVSFDVNTTEFEKTHDCKKNPYIEIELNKKIKDDISICITKTKLKTLLDRKLYKIEYMFSLLSR